MPSTKTRTKTSACRTCADPRYPAVVQSAAQGLSVRSASIAAGVHPAVVYRHRRRCREFNSRLDDAEQQGAELRSTRPSRPPAAVERAMPIIAAALAAGATRPEAAERAGVTPSHERVWRTRYPSYREAVEQAEQTQTGATR